MKIMNCPLNGPRNISEFICFGEVTDMPNPNELSDEQWADFTWMSNNTAGVIREWWCHTATTFWFIAERNTVTDEILNTYPANEVFTDRVDF
ncbi:MAG: sarcosine oxidase subunit delta [Gammaproteobacteria bacterium]|nr:MAG: sarcosine oxidase subunit delta [Gammaproteobacteria bacterium]